MDRAISPAIGIALLIACTVGLSVVVGTMAFAYEPAEPASVVAIDGEVDAAANRITLTVERGGPLDVRELTLAIAVDGEALEKQPTVPANSQSGFNGFPSGPFNAKTGDDWQQGQSASLTVAKTTNSPQPEPGSNVVVEVFENDLPIATVETTAR